MKSAINSVIVIPARLAATRLPRKLLLRETGKSLLQHTFESAKRALLPSRILIAADHAEIAEEAKRFGAEVVMTSPDCASGTDRVAEVARRCPDVDVFVNVQGDEPEIPGSSIDLAVSMLENAPGVVMSTLATPIRSRSQLEDPACVKVVFDQSVVGAARALYFSRSPIPHARQWRDELLTENPPHFFQHVGLYAYRRDFLLKVASIPRTPLEKLENLEQLRVLESGYEIAVGVVDETTFGIDTPEDYAAFVAKTRSG
jgi:3-deoxy-manno-octulosonate cytidylyltransferase (CMP-KDO synthetase)